MTDENTPQQTLTLPKINSRKQNIIETISSLGPALLLVLLIRSSVIEAFKIPSGSMIPTLLVGDQIFVNKFSYGFRVPFTDWIGDRPLYYFRHNQLSRGDIFVFKYPVDPSIYFIKRVIGLPGDTIEMKNKVVYVNGKPFDRAPIPAETADALVKTIYDPQGEYPREQMDLFYDKFDHTTGTIMINKQSYFSENFDKVTVPPDSYFAMGDNRDNSKDSRFWGFVPFDNVKGRAFVIWLSLSTDEMGDDTGKARPFKWERIGTILH